MPLQFSRWFTYTFLMSNKDPRFPRASIRFFILHTSCSSHSNVLRRKSLDVPDTAGIYPAAGMFPKPCCRPDMIGMRMGQEYGFHFRYITPDRFHISRDLFFAPVYPGIDQIARFYFYQIYEHISFHLFRDCEVDSDLMCFHLFPPCFSVSSSATTSSSIFS